MTSFDVVVAVQREGCAELGKNVCRTRLECSRYRCCCCCCCEGASEKSFHFTGETSPLRTLEQARVLWSSLQVICYRLQRFFVFLKLLPGTRSNVVEFQPLVGIWGISYLYCRQCDVDRLRVPCSAQISVGPIGQLLFLILFSCLL